LVSTNLIRRLTGNPAEMLESYCEVDRTRIADLIRGAIALPTVVPGVG
jgi:hypothetical protein